MVVDIDGSGTEQDPYLIRTVEELQAVKEDLSAHYELADDIDASNSEPEEFEPIGTSRKPFTGTFDGNNYEIRNVCINQSGISTVGLFSCIGKRGQVKNLGLISPNIEGGDCVVGSLAGDNRGEINSSYLKDGHISGYGMVGGLFGSNNGIVESSYLVESDVSGYECVGGLVGTNHSSVVSSYSIGVDVSGENTVGGLIGWNHGEVELSYSIESNVSGESTVGGLVGRSYTEPLDSSFILYSADKTNILEDADLILLRGNHTISYVVETKTLYLQINNEIYSSEVSPIEVQSLLEGAEVVKITEKFRSSVVIAT